MGLSEILKKLRLEKRMTQAELADETGLSMHAINSYESGRRQPNSFAMAKLEAYFGVNGSYLRGETKQKEREGKYAALNYGGGGDKIPQETLEAIVQGSEEISEMIDEIKLYLVEEIPDTPMNLEQATLLRTVFKQIFDK